jgi:hypothetical protein
MSSSKTSEFTFSQPQLKHQREDGKIIKAGKKLHN